MSDYLSALVRSEEFYILPVCNLPTHNQAIADPSYDAESRGFRPGGGGAANSLNSTLNNLNTFIIPDYLKNLNIDYISFSNTCELSPLNYDQSPCLVVDIRYKLVDGVNPFISGDGTSYNFPSISQDIYRTQIKVKNGELIKIDLKSLYSITDIVVTTVTQTSSADRINKAIPYNITLWKKFLKSNDNNALSFLISGSLCQGYNQSDQEL
jgi:hypothetical protein